MRSTIVNGRNNALPQLQSLKLYLETGTTIKVPEVSNGGKSTVVAVPQTGQMEEVKRYRWARAQALRPSDYAYSYPRPLAVSPSHLVVGVGYNGILNQQDHGTFLIVEQRELLSWGNIIKPNIECNDKQYKTPDMRCLLFIIILKITFGLTSPL